MPSRTIWSTWQLSAHGRWGIAPAPKRQIDWNREQAREPLSAVTHAKVTVRAGAEHDLEALNAIYNQYVKDTHFTFDLEPMTIETRREWFPTTGPPGGTGFSSRSRTRPSWDSPAAA